ncbi:MAG: right-handed parallel beta-helix repeat-containing protein, partial [Candidatus Sumerlaeia bacterium]|nr:right-handed parallel beta-helix repeat-containing protein [Candidatus Sumerlaeia bacterium]
NNLIQSNRAIGSWYGDGGGILVSDQSWAIVSNNIIQNNTVSWYGGGMHIVDNGAAHITNNIISGNTDGRGAGGICFRNTATPPKTSFLGNNLIYKNSGGITVTNGASPYIVNNTIVSNTGNGIFTAISSPIILGNIFAYNTQYGIYLWTGTATVHYNDVWNNSVGNYNGIAPP